MMIATLVIFFLMIAGFSFKKIPMALTAFSGMLLLVLFSCVEPSEALSTIANSTTMTISSMFVISAGISKTQFISGLTDLVKHVSGNSLKGILVSYVFVTFVLAQFIPSTTAVFAIVSPLAIATCNQLKIKPSKILYSIGIVTVTTAYTLTPIGPYAANFIENNGLFLQYGISGFENTAFTEMILKIPATVATILWAVFGACKLAPDYETMPYSTDVKKLQDNNVMPRYRQVICFIAFTVSLVGFMCGSFGLQAWIIPAVGAAAVVFSGALSEKEALENSGIKVVLLYAGTSCLGKAFANTGAGEVIGNLAGLVLGNTQNSYIIGFAVFLAAFVTTSLLYNRAVSKILIPVVLATAATLKCDPRGLIQMCYIGSMCSFLTPMATSVVPMMMSSVGYTQKDLLKMGWIPAILTCISTVFAGMTIFPCW